MKNGIHHYNIKVTGKVQGVFYRASTKEKAEELGIRGFVRNEPDGSVYIEAEGSENDLHKFLEWCEQGPPNAMVDEVHSAEGKVVKFGNFQIVRS